MGKCRRYLSVQARTSSAAFTGHVWDLGLEVRSVVRSTKPGRRETA